MPRDCTKWRVVSRFACEKTRSAHSNARISHDLTRAAHEIARGCRDGKFAPASACGCACRARKIVRQSRGFALRACEIVRFSSGRAAYRAKARCFSRWRKSHAARGTFLGGGFPFPGFHWRKHVDAACILQLRTTYRARDGRSGAHLDLPLPRMPAQDRQCLWRASAIPARERGSDRFIDALQPHRRFRVAGDVSLLSPLRRDGLLGS